MTRSRRSERRGGASFDTRRAHFALWLRKELPAEATPEQVKNGLTYREVPKTTLIGAIELPQKWIDFRKQEIPKGVYTLSPGLSARTAITKGRRRTRSSACCRQPTWT